MIPTFFINLDRDIDRRASIEASCKAAGLEAERIPAILGRDLPDWATQFFPPSPLTAAEVGCYASHIKTWRTILDRQLPYALVLEDDARVAPDTVDTIRLALRELPADWDYVHFEPVTPKRQLPFKPIRDLGNGRMLIRHMRIPTGTTGYLITRTGASKLVIERPRTMPVDCEIRLDWNWCLNIFGITPSPVRQDAFQSTIYAPNSKDNPKMRIHGLRSLKGQLYRFQKLGPYWWLRCHAINIWRKMF